jgi:hypothetical protein
MPSSYLIPRQVCQPGQVDSTQPKPRALLSTLGLSLFLVQESQGSTLQRRLMAPRRIYTRRPQLPSHWMHLSYSRGCAQFTTHRRAHPSLGTRGSRKASDGGLLCVDVRIASRKEYHGGCPRKSCGWHRMLDAGLGRGRQHGIWSCLGPHGSPAVAFFFRILDAANGHV